MAELQPAHVALVRALHARSVEPIEQPLDGGSAEPSIGLSGHLGRLLPLLRAFYLSMLARNFLGFSVGALLVATAWRSLPLLAIRGTSQKNH